MLPTRDLCSLKALDLASSECLQQLESNLDGLAILLGAKHGEIRYPSPILASQASFTELHQPDPLDAYERRYVTQWLAQLITKLISSDDGLNSRHEQLSDQCAELLAMCAGKMAAGASTKTHTLCTASGTELRIRLRDAALVHDSLGTHTWGAAPILSQLLLPLPESTRNILELGAGTGLVGLATSLWCRLRGHDVQVYLTDYHPQVLENLAYNVALNHLDYSASGVHVRTLDWQRIHEAETSDESAVVTAQTLSSCPPTLSTQTLWQNLLDTELRAQFDMIIAADCVYDPLHPFWIRSVANHFLRRPTESCTPSLHIMVPLRPTHRDEVDAVYAAFRPASSNAQQLTIVSETDYEGNENFGGWNNEDGQAGLTRSYRWFQIGWT